jgi:hypothetical protein
MIILDATTKSLEILLGGTVTTNQLPFVSSYVDINQSTFAVSASSENDGVTNNSTAVTVVNAPGATTSRKLNYLSVFNADTVVAVLIVRVNNNSTTRICWKGTLAVGDTLIYIDERGFYLLDTNGQIKTGPTVVSLTSGVTGILPIANGGTNASSFTSGRIPYFDGTRFVDDSDLTFSTDTLTATKLLAPTSVSTPSIISTGALTITPAAGSNLNISLSTTGDFIVNTSQLYVDTSTGFTGLGITTPGERLVVNGGISVINTFGITAYGVGVPGDANTEYIQFYHTGSGATFTVNKTGTGSYRDYSISVGGAIAVTIKTTQVVQFNTYGAGTATFDASGNITSVSDERLKTNILPFTGGLRELIAIQPIIFNFTKDSNLDTDNEYVGFSAQNVMKYLPKAVGKSENGYYSLYERCILAAMVNAITTLQEEISSLNNKLGLPNYDDTIIPITGDDNVIKRISE